ncbi:MAG: sigma-70 family RNA polymerase sigma factor [Planctomycetales bacterium]|nr:sigma-70 family RNA polymerase sigma factor [Planctomycetales bacterium]
MNTPPGSTSDAAFIQLLSKHQRHLHSFIRSLVPSDTDADDVMQDTSLALWENRGSYDSTRDYFPWACGVAHVYVLRHRRKTASDRLWFNDEVLELLASQMLEDSELFELRREALNACLDKLSEEDRRIVRIRYQEGITLGEMTQIVESSARSIQRTMVRVRRVLQRCITATLREWRVS